MFKLKNFNGTKVLAVTEFIHCTFTSKVFDFEFGINVHINNLSDLDPRYFELKINFLFSRARFIWYKYPQDLDTLKRILPETESKVVSIPVSIKD